MTEPAVPSCPCCGQPEPYGRICYGCRGSVRADLADLPALYARLRRSLLPASTGPSQPLTGTREMPLPVRVDVLDLIGRAAPGDGVVDLHGDQWGLVPIIAVLSAWEREVRSHFRYTRAVFAGSVEQSIGTVARFLSAHVDRICDDHPAGSDFIAEIAGVHYTCRRVLGETERGLKLGPCPSDDEDGKRCGQPLTCNPRATSMRCRACGTVYSRSDWLATGEAMRSDVG